MKSPRLFTLTLILASTFCVSNLVANETDQSASGKTTHELASATTAKASTPAPVPHCEVPCGIYTDQLRFEQMLEDTKTIAKSIDEINRFATQLQGPPTGKDINQVVRWVSTKDHHATNTQTIVSQYFMTQRIKPDHERYDQQIKAAHAVLVAAMKCKQDADGKTAETLKKAILDLYRAYEGKEPQEEHSHD